MMTKTLNQAILVGLVSVFAFSSAGADDINLEHYTSDFNQLLEEAKEKLEEQDPNSVYYNLMSSELNLIEYEHKLHLTRIKTKLNLIKAEHNLNITQVQNDLDLNKAENELHLTKILNDIEKNAN